MTLLDNLATFPAINPPEPAAINTSDGLRLRLRGPGVVGGFVDGGWWPRTRDLSIELPPLLVAMYSAGYDVRRVMYNITAWDRAPRRMTVGGRLVKLGGFHTQNAAAISLVDPSGRQRIDLVVVPPGTDPVIAERALALAGRDGDPRRPAQILERANLPVPARLSRAGCLDDFPCSGWETDGGRVSAA